MTHRLSNAEVEAAIKRAEAAGPEPWIDEGWDQFDETAEWMRVVGPGVVAEVPSEMFTCPGESDADLAVAIAQFIVAAKTDVPNLALDLLDARAERDALREILEPGTAPAIVASMFDVAIARGHPKHSAHHALTFLVDELDKARAERDEAREALAESERQRRNSDEASAIYAKDLDGAWAALTRLGEVLRELAEASDYAARRTIGSAGATRLGAALKAAEALLGDSR